MEIRVLGPVRIRVGTESVEAGPAQRRAVLAALAVDAGRPVMISTLVDRVWETEPPAEARAALYSYISRLRRLLAAGRRDGHTGTAPTIRLVGRGAGYLLDVEPETVDLHRFRRLVAAAGEVGSDHAERAKLLGEALQLWSGPPLADLPGQWAARMRSGWQQERLDTTVQWTDAQLQLCRGGEAIGPVRAMLEEHPLAEPLVAALMRALVMAGRHAEAAECYAAARARLADELGIEPGVQLRAVHLALLRGELDRPSGPASPLHDEHGRVRAADPAVASRSSVEWQPVPRQLPAPPPVFTGRTHEVATLSQAHDASTVVITAIDGMAGVGKTALAVHVAHRIADRYPDGQLYLDLHGYTRGVDPTEPAEALDHLLRALGVPGARIPPGLEQRAALYRSRLAGQRMLILLDNVATETQVQPLLPGSPACLALVTSRRRLAGLDHTRTVSLDILPVRDAAALFVGAAGKGQPADQPSALLKELVELCGGLPLAIRIAAARLRAHPAWELSQLVARLRDLRHRLVELAAGERSVATALDLSYQDLTDDQRRIYRLLGWHPGPDLDVYAAAALHSSTPDYASRLLDQLLDAHLLLEPVPGRYRFHDLVRAHAAQAATRDETEPARQAAVSRLLDYYRHAAALATAAAYPYEREGRVRVPPSQTPGPELPDQAPALDWLDIELPNLLAIARYAAEHGWPEHVVHLSTILHPHLQDRSRYRDAEGLHHRALATARGSANRAGELDALNDLGYIHQMQGRLDPAADHYEQALQLARSTGNRAGEATALTGLGHIHQIRGRYQQAADQYQQALQLARSTGNRAGEATALTGLGHIHQIRGRYQQAADRYQQALQLAGNSGSRAGELAARAALGQVHRLQGRYELAADQYQRALQLARDSGNRAGELIAFAGLGQVHRAQGRYPLAADYLERALRIARETGHRGGELDALACLGQVYGVQGRHASAGDHYQRLLALAEETGDPNYEFEARQGLGRVSQATGHPDAAVAHHDRALGLANDLGHPHDQARAHDGLAHAYHTLHRPERARRHWQLALDILERLGVDDTEDEGATAAAIRAQLGPG